MEVRIRGHKFSSLLTCTGKWGKQGQAGGKAGGPKTQPNGQVQTRSTAKRGRLQREEGVVIDLDSNESSEPGRPPLEVVQPLCLLGGWVCFS